MSRRRVFGMVSVAALTLVEALLASATGCAETELGLGEECLKDSDCLSGVCAAQACTDRGTFFTDAAAFDASNGEAGS